MEKSLNIFFPVFQEQFRVSKEVFHEIFEQFRQKYSKIAVTGSLQLLAKIKIRSRKTRKQNKSAMFCDQIAFPFRLALPGDSKKYNLRENLHQIRDGRKLNLTWKACYIRDMEKTKRSGVSSIVKKKNTSSLKDIYLVPPPPRHLP